MDVSDELEFSSSRPVFLVTGRGGVGKTRAAVIALSDIRAAVQEMHDSNRDEVRRLSALLATSWKAEPAAVPLPAETVATQAEKAGLFAVAKLVRAGAKWGIATIIAAIVSGPIQYEEGNIGHWTPPSITKIVQMSPRQLDELSRQILRQVEHQVEQQEHQEQPTSPRPGPGHLPRLRTRQSPP